MKALIIEDDPRILDIIATAFRKSEFLVETAQEGRKGYEKAKEQKYDIIILDLVLPGKSGLEILSSLRSLGVATPILVVSGKTSVEDRILGLELGADDYLIKHFSTDELIARAHNLIRRHPKTRNILRCGDLVANLSTMEIRRKTIPIFLTRKETRILFALMRRKNSVVPRSDIQKSVWGDHETPPLSNTIETHIKSLRQKIDLPFAKNTIRTLRGIGYMAQDL